MILIETKMNGADVIAKIRVHTQIEGYVPGRPFPLDKQPTHGHFWLAKSDDKKYAIYGNNAALRTSIGKAWGNVDGNDVTIYRVDVDKAFRGRGYSLALMYAALQRAVRSGAKLTGVVRLIADESESTNLREYYTKMGFISDSEHGDVDKPGQQFPMKGLVGPVAYRLWAWMGARYSGNVSQVIHN